METVYKNIAGTGAAYILRGIDIKAGSRSNLRTIAAKCLRVTNTHTSTITLDVYIKAIDIAATEHQHGALQNNYNANTDSYLTSVNSTYYLAKGIKIPVGVTLQLFLSSPLSFINEFSLIANLGAAAETADLVFNYTSEKIDITNTTRTINQY